jgi:hypothetical protein
MRVATSTLSPLHEQELLGTRFYEPADHEVVAIDPSPVMIVQRPANASPVAMPAKRSGFIGPQPRGQIVEDRERDVVVTAQHRGFTHAGLHGKAVTVCQFDELVGV